MVNKIAENIEVVDKIENINTSKINTKTIDASSIQTNQIEKINYDDYIGYLTIPGILLEKAPIKESTELDILSQAIGHFTNTSIYQGNIGLASHNSGGQGDYFKNLKDIKIGSKIYYQTQYGTKSYIVNTKVEIEETNFNYLKQTQDNRITLITCVKGQKEKRLCVQAVEDIV